MWFVGIVWSLICLGILVWWIGRSDYFRLEGVSPRTVQAVFLVKVVAGLSLWAIYTWYYPYRITSDAYGYFDDAMVLHHYLSKDPAVWFRFFFGINTEHPDLAHVRQDLVRWSSSYNYGMPNDNQTIIRMNMLLALISQGVYHIHTLAFSMISLLGSIWFLRGVRKFFKDDLRLHNRNLLYGICLLPSVLFWSSGVLKEAPMVAALGALVLSTGAAIRRGGWQWLWVMLALCGGLLIKPYVFIAVIPAVIGVFFARLAIRHRWLIFSSVLLACYGVAAKAGSFFSAGDMLYILSKKQQDFYNVAHMNEAGSAVFIAPVNQSFWGFLAQIPERLCYAIARPWPLDYGGIFYLLPIFESALLLVSCTFIIILLTRKQVKVFHGLYVLPDRTSLWWPFALSFILVYAVILGSTVPVLGALVRYKLPLLIMFGTMMALISSQPKESTT